MGVSRSAKELNAKMYKATLVVGERLLTQSLAVLPEWWGVLYARPTRDNVEFTTIREPRNNPRRDPRALVELLWFEQALTLLEQHDTARGVRGKPRRIVWDRICDRIGINEIATAVRAGLKARAGRGN